MDEATKVGMAEAKFTTQWEGGNESIPIPQSVLVECNSDDVDLCEWLRVAEVGEEWRAGGGAAPRSTIRRVP